MQNSSRTTYLFLAVFSFWAINSLAFGQTTAEIVNNSVHGGMDCVECHTDIKDPAVDKPTLKVDCSSCHADEAKAFTNSVHSRAARIKGLNIAPGCADCHGTHNILPPTDSKSTVHKQNVPETCRKCHSGIFDEYTKSIHGQLLISGREDAPVCTSCHNEHDIADPQTKASQQHIPQECGQCHQAKVSTYADTFHGKSTSLGFTGAAKCSGCHTAHNILPKSDPNSSINKAQLTKTCGQCHTNVNKNFTDYDPHVNPHDKNSSAIVFYTYHFMNWLLLITLSFWGLHTALWFQRSVVAIFRREFVVENMDGKYIRRFSNFQRRMHGIVVVSFIGLVITGLPLKYYYASWALNMSAVLGGVEINRYFHRVFGIITLGYFLLHILQMLYLIIFKKQSRLVSGPESMMPRHKDWVDFIDNLKWFFYQGDRPKYDRWTYFEKFDYMAVFWGVCVIGISGLIMWQPTFFTQFLPGAVINAAAIIHSDEALLALAFIFTIHFFHNHLRVENFPIDLSIFSGVIPLDRFIKERPQEYERLVKEGKLEKYLVPPPSRKTIIKCFIFGFTALGIGFLMIMAIFVTQFGIVK